ncbi:MAG TPA: Gfo/Idh/MocA family oxidoreductase [Tepidisphaeraceae bacterium]|nr:Gfo/Idh/MocA family oxidoreductase [Tepidisphaeraceae bacterium]
MIRWGILGTGNIAGQFCGSFGTVEHGSLVAVGSRSAESAKAFAERFSIPHALGDYQALVTHKDVDAIYNSLPNSMHHEWTIKALEAGKHVLCEKPLASDAAEAEEMFDAAHKAGRLLVEAFMYRSHPQTLAVMEQVRNGAIGVIRLLRSSFCYYTANTGGNIRFSKELAGGALMDIGCYCLDFSRLFGGAEPIRAAAVGQLYETGVDIAAAGSLEFPGGVLASFTCAMNTHADNTAYICGTEGFIEIPVPWKPPKDATFRIRRSAPPKMDGAAAAIKPPPPLMQVHVEKDLYALEADDFALAAQGKMPPRMSRADSLGNMRLLDTLRKQIGVRI